MSHLLRLLPYFRLPHSGSKNYFACEVVAFCKPFGYRHSDFLNALNINAITLLEFCNTLVISHLSYTGRHLLRIRSVSAPYPLRIKSVSARRGYGAFTSRMRGGCQSFAHELICFLVGDSKTIFRPLRWGRAMVGAKGKFSNGCGQRRGLLSRIAEVAAPCRATLLSPNCQSVNLHSI